jgi:hypothetical protein
MSSRSFPCGFKEFIDIGCSGYKKLEKTGVSKPPCFAEAKRTRYSCIPFVVEEPPIAFLS